MPNPDVGFWAIRSIPLLGIYAGTTSAFYKGLVGCEIIATPNESGMLLALVMFLAKKGQVIPHLLNMFSESLAKISRVCFLDTYQKTYL